MYFCSILILQNVKAIIKATIMMLLHQWNLPISAIPFSLFKIHKHSALHYCMCQTNSSLKYNIHRKCSGHSKGSSGHLLRIPQEHLKTNWVWSLSACYLGKNKSVFTRTSTSFCLQWTCFLPVLNFFVCSYIIIGIFPSLFTQKAWSLHFSSYLGITKLLFLTLFKNMWPVVRLENVSLIGKNYKWSN